MLCGFIFQGGGHMTDGPVIGQVGLAGKKETLKVEIIGSLKPKEWAEFVECLRECLKRYPGKLRILKRKYKAPAKRRPRRG
jgi:hypothetical protein